MGNSAEITVPIGVNGVYQFIYAGQQPALGNNRSVVVGISVGSFSNGPGLVTFGLGSAVSGGTDWATGLGLNYSGVGQVERIIGFGTNTPAVYISTSFDFAIQITSNTGPASTTALFRLIGVVY